MILKKSSRTWLAVLLVALLTGCGGGGGGGTSGSTGGGGSDNSTSSVTSSTSTTPVPVSSPVASQNKVNVNMTFSTTAKTVLDASAAADGLPAATVNVIIHFIDPATDRDVVPATQAPHKLGDRSQTVSVANVPSGSYVVMIQALDANNNPIGYFHSTIGVTASTTNLTVASSVDLTSLALTPPSASIIIGATYRLVATATFSDSSTETVNAVADWTSSAPTIASVAFGTCTGLAGGSSLMTAVYGGKTASMTVTVGPGGSPSPSPSPIPAGSPTRVGTQVCAQCHTAGPYANYYVAGDAIDGTSSSPTFMDARAYGSLYNNYVASVHSTPVGSTVTDVVTCEGCHGAGSQHYGVGPIPNYMASVAQCGACHDASKPGASVAATDTIDLAGFLQSGHANPDSLPDKFFQQGGVGTTQATLFGQTEWKDSGATIPVSKNEHIEECSVCHSPDQKSTHIANGDVQDPPQAGCAACHDPHAPADAVRNYVSTRPVNGSPGPVTPDDHLNLKPVQVNTALTYGPPVPNANPVIPPYGTTQTYMAAAQFGSSNKTTGTWIRPRITFAYNAGGNPASTFSGYTNQSTAAGDWLRTTPERLCASCHAASQYKYGRVAGSTATNTTHQSDIYTQYRFSAHAAKYDAPWLDFSLLDAPGTSPTFTGSAGHRPHYPFDMGGKAGQDGVSGTKNGTTNVAFATPFDGTTEFSGGKAIGANNFQCFQCHNGIGAIDYIKGTVGGNAIGDTQDTHVVWGDSTVTCVTCHDPHAAGKGNTKNIRVPKYLSYNPEFRPDRTPNGLGNKRGAVNLFQDLSPIPAGTGNNLICLDCHQGRESGWSAWNKARIDRIVVAKDQLQPAADFWYNFPYTKINATSFSYVNDHYLAAGSLLYGRNATEFLYDPTDPKSVTAPATARGNAKYSDGIPKHQAQGCVGCHMSNATSDSQKGGHTFTPNIKTCQQCHAGMNTFHDVFAPADWSGNGSVETVFNELGTINPIAASQAKGVFGNANGIGGTGLFGLLNQALYDAGIRYDPNAYPYFYTATYDGTAGSSFTKFTPNILAVCQNINQLYKSGGTNEQAVYVHNPQFAAQVLIDSIIAIRQFTTTNAWITGGANVPAANPSMGYTVNLSRPTGYTDTSAGTPTLHSPRDYRLPAFDNNGQQTTGYTP